MDVDDPVPAGLTINDDGELRWSDLRFPALFVGMGVVAMVSIGLSPAERTPVFAIALVLLAVTPWILAMFDRILSDLPFVSLVLAPIWFLITFGETLEIVDLDGGSAQLVLMLLIGLVGQVAAVADRNRTAIVVGATLAVVVSGAIARGDPLDFGPWVVGILLAAGGGRAFRNSFFRLVELRQAQAELADQRIAEERRRIAREVHDIVAHTMSVTMLHLTAARMAVRSNPDAAEEALIEAERHGRSSMDDIRRVVRLLRTDESAVDAALPTDADLAGLIDQFRSAGSTVNAALDADVADCTGPVRLTLFRVVQESLSNAVRHGAGPIDVSTATRDGELRIVVANDVVPGRREGAGTGIEGMSERVTAVGGRLDAGPDAAGRWLVDARIPT